MAQESKIEWTDGTWTPIRARNLATGKIGWHCEHATTGCEFCFSEGMNKRLGTGLPFKPGHRKDIEIFLDEDMLLAPQRWKKPRMIFVCSMTDAFADFVKDEWLDKMFAVMALCPQHTFQVLTKRPERMRKYLSDPDRGNREHFIVCGAMSDLVSDDISDRANRAMLQNEILPNVWLGTSVERQQEADERIPLLLQTPAAVRFISAEPLLGPIDFVGGGRQWLRTVGHDGCATRAGLDQIITGGESGPRARPMHPQWARDIRDQCKVAGVSFFFKQWGEWGEIGPYGPRMVRAGDCFIAPDGRRHILGPDLGSELEAVATPLRRVGKKAAGRLLDGIEHNGFPATGGVSR